MMEKNIVIQVIGTCHSGKTTVAEMIKELFDLYGIKTEFIDPDLPFKANLIVPGDEEETKKRNNERKRDRTIAVINSLKKITIEEVQAQYSEPLDIFN